VQEELVHVVSLVVPGEPRLPPQFEQELGRLPALNDEQLWNAARTVVVADVDERLEELADLRRERGLDEQEVQEQARLLKECHRVMLIRAHAALLLKQRGHDISSLGPEQ